MDLLARPRRSLLTLVLGLAALLSGCAVQPAAAPEAAPAVTPASATAAFPRTVTDGAGHVVTIPHQPQRIVSLTLATDEILLSLVDTSRVRAVTYLAGDSLWTNVSALAQQVEHTVESDPEQIIALEPDLVLAATYNNPDHVKLLRDAGITVVVVALFDTVGQIAANIRFVAHLTGDEARAEELITAMEERLAAIEAQVAQAESKPRVLFYTSFGSSAGTGSTFSDIVRRAGGINLGDEALDGPFGEISLEKIVELDPDVIITDEWAPADATTWQENFANHPALANVSARRNGRIHTVPARHLSTLSHYIVEGVYDVAKLLHPDLVE